LVKSKETSSSEIGSAKIVVKTMLTAFFYAKGIVHHEFVQEKQTANGKIYKEMFRRLIPRVHCVKPEFQ
jgi:hypothetical protein